MKTNSQPFVIFSVNLTKYNQVPIFDVKMYITVSDKILDLQYKVKTFTGNSSIILKNCNSKTFRNFLGTNT